MGKKSKHQGYISIRMSRIRSKLGLISKNQTFYYVKTISMVLISKVFIIQDYILTS